MKKLITESVNRFLGWKLPSDFAPDAGITFKRDANPDSPIELQYKHEPTGTNLFHTGQVEAMLLHIAKPLTDKIEALESDLEIQTKVFIAACEDLALIAEKLGVDPEDGGASPILDCITELEAQLADAKQVANDCRIVADNAIAEAKKYQWQPIETAPKDGEPILLCVGNVTGSGRYRSLHRTISAMLNFYFDGATLHSGATHWMPLPPAPAIQAEGKA